MGRELPTYVLTTCAPWWAWPPGSAGRRADAISIRRDTAIVDVSDRGDGVVPLISSPQQFSHAGVGDPWSRAVPGRTQRRGSAPVAGSDRSEGAARGRGAALSSEVGLGRGADRRFHPWIRAPPRWEATRGPTTSAAHRRRLGRIRKRGGGRNRLVSCWLRYRRPGCGWRPSRETHRAARRAGGIPGLGVTTVARLPLAGHPASTVAVPVTTPIEDQGPHQRHDRPHPRARPSHTQLERERRKPIRSRYRPRNRARADRAHRGQRRSV